MDPLSIASAQGTGEAQVLPRSNRTPYDYYSQYAEEKASKEEEQQKQNQQLLKGLDDIKLGGFVKDNQYLYDFKTKLQNRVAQQLQKTKGKYNWLTDEEFVKDVNKLREMNELSRRTQELFAAEYDKLQTGKDQYDPTSAKEVETFYNMPIEQRKEYLKTKEMPTLRPKEKEFDPVKLEQAYTAPLKPTKTGGYKVLPDGNVLDWENIDYKNKNAIYSDIFSTEEGGKYKDFLARELESKSPLEQKDIVSRAKAEGITPIQYMAKTRLDKYLETGYKADLKQKAGGGFTFGAGGSLESNSHVYTINERTETEGTSREISPYAAGEKKIDYVTITPRPKRGGDNKSATFYNSNGDFINMVPTGVERKTDSGDWVITGYEVKNGKKKPKEVPYSQNEGTWLSQFDASPAELEAEINKSATEKVKGKGAEGGAKQIGGTKQKTKYVKGYEEGGYRFKGGDPTKQSNWEKI